MKSMSLLQCLLLCAMLSTAIAANLRDPRAAAVVGVQHAPQHKHEHEHDEHSSDARKRAFLGLLHFKGGLHSQEGSRMRVGAKHHEAKIATGHPSNHRHGSSAPRSGGACKNGGCDSDYSADDEKRELAQLGYSSWDEKDRVEEAAKAWCGRGKEERVWREECGEYNYWITEKGLKAYREMKEKQELAQAAADKKYRLARAAADAEWRERNRKVREAMAKKKEEERVKEETEKKQTKERNKKCTWNYSKRRCDTPKDLLKEGYECAYRYQFGDMHLGQSCRSGEKRREEEETPPTSPSSRIVSFPRHASICALGGQGVMSPPARRCCVPRALPA